MQTDDQDNRPPAAAAPEAAADEPPSGEAAPDGTALPGVSLMITRRQKAALRDLGVSEEEIRHMTPAEAHARLGL
ncbi:hypothetical protein [Lichenibacterium ramalinae]|uniref:Uncharacterized protein n=1 Tax=Lichenibacterium ramalinae TaxID=2316527 RepID=A0A4Q2RGE5_9HYPH|nr:hypothetical protein [Lichenibacterium ramalinae]RYB04773.1 hypothetical protein D3272_12605 [Lichenibacterium ramalinae]